LIRQLRKTNNKSKQTQSNKKQNKQQNTT